MKKAIIFIIIAALIIFAVLIGLFFMPIPRTINITSDGYIIYLNGNQVNCSVTITGKYQDYLFNNNNTKDIFDGTIIVNGSIIGINYDRIVFNGEAGNTSYRSTSTDKSGKMTILRLGDKFLSKDCDTVVISCCYDSLSNTDTADETFRCLIIAPAKNSEDAKNILEDYAAYLRNFDSWDFK